MILGPIIFWINKTSEYNLLLSELSLRKKEKRYVLNNYNWKEDNSVHIL